jgi:hypothetical protein
VSYFISTPPMRGAPGEVHDSAQNAIGAEAIDNDGREYVYLKGVASTIAGSWVAYDEAGQTVGLDSDDSTVGPVAIATAAVVANKFGWYGRKGSFSASAGDVADNARVFMTSTVFVCDDAELDDMQVHGAVWRSEDANSLATVQINRPWVGLAVDASA